MQILVKSLVIITMRTFNLTVMPWSSRTYELMHYVKILAKHIELMYSPAFRLVITQRKLPAVIRLYNFRTIPEELERP